jgi:hypothetical protein
MRQKTKIMRISFNYGTSALNCPSKNISFSSIETQPQNKEQVQKISQIAYKTKETVQKRFGSETPVLMKANITRDTITFSYAGNTKAKQNLADGIMQFYLRKTNIPFKQI